MIVSVHQPQYLPWLGYFHKIANSDCFVFLDCVQYKKREFQNRNRIRTKDGWVWLTVPVISKDKENQLICQVKINNDFPWQRKHLNSIKLSYKEAPYFFSYIGFFEEVYSKKWLNLIDLNLAIINFLLEKFSIKTPIKFLSQLNIKSTKTERIIEICKSLGADTYLSGIGGKDYLDEELFKKNNIKLIYQEFKHPIYRQCYSPFISQLSAIDLLFNCGDGSIKILLGK
ncbi:MAG: WbqC family protein [Candidatus Omnitrophica bacterium]|nr:WbqC family protein [Candidatus Omnitrophota bacterium]